MTEKREHSCAPVRVPESLVTAVSGYAWAQDRVGQSGASIYRLHGKPGAPDAFLKHGRAQVAEEVTAEMVRLRWLGRHIPVPAVQRFVADADEAWLLMTAVEGETAWQALVRDPASRDVVVDALARFLRRLHAVPVAECPFTSGHEHRLAFAHVRMEAGLVDEADFDEERQGWSAGQVWDALQDLLPLTPDSVVTHGDFSLDNVVVRGGEVVGCIDVGRAGIADRYQDLAIVWNGLGAFGASLQERLFDRYGIAQIDARKLAFHLMLDEMF